MRRFLLIYFMFVGIFNIPSLKSATYTHRLEYSVTNAGEGGELFGLITFEDTNDPGTDASFFDAIDRSFIVNVTYTYTTATGTVLTLDNLDITNHTMTHNAPGATDYSTFAEDGLYDQLAQLHFFGNGDFSLGGNFGSNYILNADDGSGTTDDFVLDGSTYISPGPLPILGLLSAFGTIKRLKKRFKLINDN